MATTTAGLAADLGVNEGDVDVLLLELLDEQPPDLPDGHEFVGDLFQVLPQATAEIKKRKG